jgi:hypothetical protein
MRELPFQPASFDAIVSAYAIDHVNRQGIQKSLAEAARVIKPGGDFLLILIGKEPWGQFAFGPLLMHAGTRGSSWWTAQLEQSGFQVLEEGTRPGTFYLLSAYNWSSCPSAGTPPLPPLTGNQIRSFLAAWGGWTLDGMDSFIYALVLVPALKDLLPRSGIPNTPANIGFYGGLLFALFLVGWGLAFLWGPVGDRFGRVRTLTLTIVCYSLFTFLGALATSVWQLGTFRLLAGFGIGGEWTWEAS